LKAEGLAKVPLLLLRRQFFLRHRCVANRNQPPEFALVTHLDPDEGGGCHGSRQGDRQDDGAVDHGDMVEPGREY